MLEFTYCILMCTAAIGQLNDATVEQVKKIISDRDRLHTYSAVYEIDGPPGPSILGRRTTCRCYATNGEYFVEEKCDLWTFEVWILKSRVVLRYHESGGNHVFIRDTDEFEEPQRFLEDNGFPICRIPAFDQQAVAWASKATCVEVSKQGFQLKPTTTSLPMISYEMKHELPSWREEKVEVLNDIDAGKISHEAVKKPFSFTSLMEQISEEDAKEIEIPLNQLGNASQLHGYLFPNVPGIEIVKATSLNRGRSLFMVLKSMDERFECLEYRLDIQWEKDGLLKQKNFGDTVLKSETLGKGELLLISVRGQTPGWTVYVLKSGKAFSIVGDHYSNEKLRDLLKLL